MVLLARSANCLPGSHPSINGKFPPRCVDCGNDGVNAGIFLLQWFAIIVVSRLCEDELGGFRRRLSRENFRHVSPDGIHREGTEHELANALVRVAVVSWKVSSFNLSSAATQCLLMWTTSPRRDFTSLCLWLSAREPFTSRCSSFLRISVPRDHHP